MDFSNLSEIATTVVTAAGGKTAVAAIAYGVLSDVIGQLNIKPNSVPALIWAFIRGGFESVMAVKGSQPNE